MKVSELYRKLLKVHVDGPDDDIGGGVVQTIVGGANVTVDETDPAHPVVAASGGGGGLLPGEVVTEVTGDDGGVGNASDGNVPIFAYRWNSRAHDQVQIWGNGIYLGPGISAPTAYIAPDGDGLRLSGDQITLSSGGVVAAGEDAYISTSGGRIAFFGGAGGTLPAAIADATDAGSAITQLNLLLAAMRALGLIAT